MHRILAAVTTAALLTACTAGATSSPAVSGGPTPSEAASPGGVPETCPSIIILAPDGTPVDLNGEWGGGEWFPSPGTGERTFMLQRGACVWASIMDNEFRANPQPEASQLALFYGVLGSDLIVDGTLVVIMRWNEQFTYGTQAPGPVPMRLRLDFRDDGLYLVEDREPGIQGPRCPNPVMWCPTPTVLDFVAPAEVPAS